jgi:SAM-dependent methyltransferase
MPRWVHGICPVCASHRFRVLGRVDPERCRLLPPAGSCIAVCADCDLVRAEPMPHWSGADLQVLYGEGYFPAYSAAWQRRRAHDIPARRLRCIEKHLRAPGRSLLEIGAGVQAFLCRYAAARGWDVTAQEPSHQFAAELLRQWPDLPILGGSFLDLDASRRWSVVYADSVLEHVPDPVPYFEKAAQLLEPGGVLYFVSPNERSLANRLTTWRQRRTTGVASELCPYFGSFHLIGYSRRAVEILARRARLRLVRFERRHDYAWLRELESSAGLRRWPRAAWRWLVDRIGLGSNLEVVLRADRGASAPGSIESWARS